MSNFLMVYQIWFKVWIEDYTNLQYTNLAILQKPNFISLVCQTVESFVSPKVQHKNPVILYWCIYKNDIYKGKHTK